MSIARGRARYVIISVWNLMVFQLSQRSRIISQRLLVSSSKKFPVKQFHKTRNLLLPTHYETLGVSQDADTATIKKAFYNLAKKYHPDANPNSKDAQQKFVEITNAYETLRNPDKRRKYDTDLKYRASNPFGARQQQQQYQSGYQSYSNDPFAEFQRKMNQQQAGFNQEEFMRFYSSMYGDIFSELNRMFQQEMQNPGSFKKNVYTSRDGKTTVYTEFRTFGNFNPFMHNKQHQQQQQNYNRDQKAFNPFQTIFGNMFQGNQATLENGFPQEFSLSEPNSFIISNPDVVMEMSRGFAPFANVRFRDQQISMVLGNKVLSARPTSVQKGSMVYNITNENGSNVAKLEIQSAFAEIPIVRNWIRVFTVYDPYGVGIYAGRSMKSLFGGETYEWYDKHGTQVARITRYTSLFRRILGLLFLDKGKASWRWNVGLSPAIVNNFNHVGALLVGPIMDTLKKNNRIK